MDMLSHDVRFAIRTLLARPAFTLTVVVTLALGIGANAVIFSAVDAIVLNPFDFEEPDRIIGVGTIYPRLNVDLGFFERLSAPEFADIEREVTAFEAVAAFDIGNRQIIGGDVPQNLFTTFWWHDVLSVLGLEPVLGRGLAAAYKLKAMPVTWSAVPTVAVLSAYRAVKSLFTAMYAMKPDMACAMV